MKSKLWWLLPSSIFVWLTIRLYRKAAEEPIPVCGPRLVRGLVALDLRNQISAEAQEGRHRNKCDVCKQWYPSWPRQVFWSPLRAMFVCNACLTKYKPRP